MLLSTDQFETILQESPVLILDTRPLEDLLIGYIPNSIHAPKHQIGKLIAMGFIELASPILLVVAEGKEEDTLLLFNKLGFTQIKGVLKNGFAAWSAQQNKIDLLIEVEADELAMDIPFDEYLMILDIRTEDHYNKGHIKNSVPLPLFELVDPGNMSELDEHFNIYIISDNGEDAAIAATLLKKEGIHNHRIVFGGWEAIENLKEKFTIEVTKPVKKDTDELFN